MALLTVLLQHGPREPPPQPTLIYPLRQRPANLFGEEPESEYVRFWRPYLLSANYSTLPLL